LNLTDQPVAPTKIRDENISNLVVNVHTSVPASLEQEARQILVSPMTIMVSVTCVVVVSIAVPESTTCVVATTPDPVTMSGGRRRKKKMTLTKYNVRCHPYLFMRTRHCTDDALKVLTRAGASC
jgi:hypothetical protein